MKCVSAAHGNEYNAQTKEKLPQVVLFVAVLEMRARKNAHTYKREEKSLLSLSCAVAAMAEVAAVIY
jgi:hypothetical protein